MIVMKLSLILVLLVMGFQDFKFRAISWYLFPVLATLLLFANTSFDIYRCIVNIGFVAAIFVLLTAWFSLKDRGLVNLTERHLGLGDLLFLLSMAFFFSPVNFFFFYLFSLMLVTISTGLYFILFKPESYTVPLAGMQGIILMCVLITGWCLDIDFSNADLLYSFTL